MALSPPSVQRDSPRQKTGYSETGNLNQVLANLYEKHLAQDPGNHYVEDHARKRSVANRVLTFQCYKGYLPPRGTLLDWGCQHAPDSCLIRAAFGERFQYHGCDFPPAHRYPIFHEFAGLQYTQLQHHVELPYDSQAFEVVVGAGVLEHVAQDYESLKEIYRVLKPNGIFIITYLPNWLSAQEWIRRVIRRRAFHQRLYGKGEIRQLLKRVGFLPLHTRHQNFFWDRWQGRMGLGRGKRILTPLLSTLLPFHRFGGVLCLAARKVAFM